MATAKKKKKPALSFDDLHRFNLENILCLVKHEEHAKTCFDEMYSYLEWRGKRNTGHQKMFLRYFEEGFDDTDMARGESIFISDDIIYRMVVDGETKALDVLDKLDDKQGKMAKAIILIHMTSFFHQVHRLTHVFTSSDFWNTVDGGNFLDGKALSFYLLHAMRNRVFEDLNNRHRQMKRMGENYAKLYSDEDDLIKTRIVLSGVIDSIHKKVREEINSEGEMISVFFKSFAKHFDSNDQALGELEWRFGLDNSIMNLAAKFLTEDEGAEVSFSKLDLTDNA